MSVIEKNNYSNCPLKKRPIYVIKEEIEIVPEINDAVPVDLSSSTRKKPYKIEKINNNAIDLSESRLPPIKENIKEEIYEYHHHLQEQQQQQQSFCNDISYPNSEAWYGNELRYCNTSTNSSKGFTTNRLDFVSQNSHRESSMSPHPPPSPIIRVNNCSEYRETIYKNPYRNYNNNVVSTTALHYPDQQHNIIPTSDYLMLSPSSSHLSYGSNQSDIGDYSEPEDLSVRNKKKILMPTDSSVNIEKHKKTYSELGSNDLYYQCRSCNKCYSTYGGLVKHQQTHTLQNELRSNEIAELKTIPLVPRTDFTGKNKLNGENSKILTSPRYKCKDCGKSYSTFSGLTKHQQFHCPAAEGNQVKKLFSCKNCEKVYVSLGALKMHIRTHTLPCKCPLCGKAFSRPWLLQGHIRTHTGEKPFTCEHCHRAFADRSNLRAHLQTHSDVKKYSCTSCTKTFSRMSLLGKHLQGGCPGMTSNCPNYDREYYEEQTQYEESRRQTVDSTTTTDGHHRMVYEENSNTSRDYTTVEHLYKEDVGIYC